MPKTQAPYIPQTGSEFTADWFSDCLQEQFGAAVLDVVEDGQVHRRHRSDY